MVVLPTSNDTDLKQLLGEVASGRMQLPEFQRDWTWDDARIRGLIASLTQGYPMGAIMRLAYGNPEIRFKYRTIEGVGELSVEPEFLILDGQQRMTSIYRAMHSDKPVATRTDKGKAIERYYYLDIEKCLDDGEDRVDAVVAVPADRRLKENFDRDVVLDLSTRELEIENKMFPVNVMFNDTEKMNWALGFMMGCAGDPDATSLFERFNSEVLSVVSAYKLPVITLDKSTPRVAVCKVFENVNTGGVPLTVFELVTAMFATREFDLRMDWNDCRKTIVGEGSEFKTDLFEGIDETAFLTTVTLYSSYMRKRMSGSGSVSCKKKDVLALEYEDYLASREAVLDGFAVARELLLTYECVYRKRDLPYAMQLIPLSAICAVLGRKRSLEPNVIKVLSRWYWCGILGEMYGGANETRYANDIEDVIDEVEGRQSLNRTVNAAFFSATRLLTLRTRLSAAYKGIMALLYRAGCRDFMNDTTMDVVNCITGAPDIHHIFPEAYCEKIGIPRERYDCVVNKTPILYATNRSIGGSAPSAYLARIVAKVEGVDEDDLRGRVESHQADFGYMKADDFESFFLDRASRILSLIEGAMGKPVGDRASETTVRAFGTAL